MRQWLWKIRVARCWKQACQFPDDRIGQFYSNVGYYIARGFLPVDILERKEILSKIKV